MLKLHEFFRKTTMLRLPMAILLVGAMAASPLRAQELTWTSFGAARSVSGSMHLVQWGERRMLLDCGSYFSDESAVQVEGGTSVETLNTTLPKELGKIDFVILSHAHLDHSGRLPVLARSGWRGPILATPATIAICRHMLAMPFRYGPMPAEDLYRKRGTKVYHSNQSCPAIRGKGTLTKERTTRQSVSAHGQSICRDCVNRDLEALLLQFVPLPYGQWMEPVPGVKVRLSDAGHIIGAAVAELEFGGGRRLVFSGDLGGQIPLLVNPPKSPEKAEIVAVESTYGGGVRDVPLPPYSDFEAALAKSARASEPVVIVAYTLDRTQRVLFLIRRAQKKGLLPADLSVTMPSPSAVTATDIYERLLDVYGTVLFTKEVTEFGRSPGAPFRPPQLHTRDEGSTRGVFIIPAGLEFSKTGQRILARILPNPRGHVYSVGYADPDSIVGNILANKPPKIEGVEVPIRAEIHKFSVFSGHADSEEMLQWVKPIQGLRRVLVVHGEAQNADALAKKLHDGLGVEVIVPERGKPIALGK